MRRVSIITAVLSLVLAGTAQAHPKLVSSNPAADAVVAQPTRIELNFSERLMPKFSAADVMMAMQGMAPMKVTSTATLLPDGRTLVLSLNSPLPAGRYNVAWHVVSTDTHKVAGNLAFAVK